MNRLQTLHLPLRARTSRAGSLRRPLGAALLLAASMFVLIAAPAAHAAECALQDNYEGPVGGSWNTAANWSTKSVPGKEQSVCVPAGKGTLEVVGVEANALYIVSHSALRIAAGAVLTVSEKAGVHNSSVDGLTVAEGGTLNLRSIEPLVLLVTGEATVDGEVTAPEGFEERDQLAFRGTVFSGHGKIGGQLAVFEGSLKPADAGSKDKLTVAGPFSIGPSATLVLAVDSSTEFDEIDATYDKESPQIDEPGLEVILAPGYIPARSTKWQFLRDPVPATVGFEHPDGGFSLIQDLSGDGASLELVAEDVSVETGAISSISQTTAVAAGLTTPHGLVTGGCEVEYAPVGTPLAYSGTGEPCTPAAGPSTTEPSASSTRLENLLPNTEYHYRLAAASLGLTIVSGAEKTFRTLPEPPAISGESASGESTSAAALAAAVNPNGSQVLSCELEYGTTEALGAVLPCGASPGAGMSPVPVSLTVSGLAPSTRYYYRYTAANAGGTGHGATLSFTTLPPGRSAETGTGGETTVTTPGGGQTTVATGTKGVEEVLRGCTTSPLTLSDVVIHGNRVILTGSAESKLAGRRVSVVFDGARTVATTTIAANGLFSTTAPLPPARLRTSNSARYQAVLGSLRSLNLKLTRRLVLEPPTASGTTVTLTGQLVPPLTRPVGRLYLYDRFSCGAIKLAATITPPAGGRFHITVPIPAGARAGIFRLEGTVGERPGSRHGFKTYSLPLPATLP